MAANRQNERVGDLHDPTHLGVLRAIEQTVTAAHAEDAWVGMCGEMAGDPELTELLVGLGLDELSMSAVTIPEVKTAVSETEYSSASERGDRARLAATRSEVYHTRHMKLVAVTSCPTGIAHSQMAAENLEQTAAEQGHDIKVEVQGAMGAENELSDEDVAAADAAIIAADTSVSQDRFSGVPLIDGTVKDAVNDAEGMIADAIAAADGDAPATGGEGEDSKSTSTESDQQRRRGGDRSKSLVARLKRLFS